jgi:hypothetical protein
VIERRVLMTAPPAPRAVSILRVLLLAVACGYLGLYIGLAMFRMRYPFELEWMEGAMVEQSQRVLEGRAMYAPPTVDYIGFVYPPLYFVLSACVSWVTGPGFLPLRLVSFAASIGSFVVIYRLLRRETGDWYPGVIAACLFAATYKLGGAWFDVGRTDSLFLFLLLLAMYVLRFAETNGGMALAGLCVAASFLSKQTGLLGAMPLVMYAVSRGWRAAAIFIGTIGGVLGVTTLVFNLLDGGWYSTYVFTWALQQGTEHENVWNFWTNDLIFAAPIASGLLVAWLVAARAGDRRPFLFYLCSLLGLIGCAWTSRAQIGGWTNALVPAYAALAIGVGLTMASRTPRAMLLCLVQFTMLAYDPRAQLPTARDEAAGRDFLERLRAIDGDVWLLHHGYIGQMAGKKPHATVHHFWDLHGPARDAYMREMADRLCRGEFAAVIIDSKGPFSREVSHGYSGPVPLWTDPSVFFTITGRPGRPEVIWTRKPLPPVPPGANPCAVKAPTGGE